MSRPEPEWDDGERAWALALAEEESDTCDGCGHLLSETTAVDGDGDSLHRYRVTYPILRCHACTALARATKPNEDGMTFPEPGALRFHIERVEGGVADG